VRYGQASYGKVRCGEALNGGIQFNSEYSNPMGWCGKGLMWFGNGEVGYVVVRSGLVGCGEVWAININVINMNC
jgi:hypothetical protein